MVALIAVSLFTVLPDPTEKWPEAARAELKRLQGRWKVEKHVIAGNESTPTEEQVFEIKGRFILNDGVAGAEFVALDPHISPKCVDFKERDTDRTDPVTEGVYKLDGDTLTFCAYMGEGKNRPTDFDAKANGYTAIVLKRVKE